MFKLFLIALCSWNFHCAAHTPKVLSQSPRVVWVENFLSDKECDHLISLSAPHLERSTVLDEGRKANQGKVDDRRTSQGMFLTPGLEDKVVRQIEQRIADLTHYPVENGESLQVLRYRVGGEYQPHYDFFNSGTQGGAAALARGGQRMISVIMYLKAPSKGGETIFPRLNLSITPKKGGALVFYNCLDGGKEDLRTLHGGAKVLEGEKWIATKWIRKGVFQ